MGSTPKQPVTISKTTARRFVLGRQGLWPGRRWSGLQGTAEALGAVEAVQVDPLNVIARSHDLVLHSRVLDYRPEHLQHWLYRERAFFEYGGVLFIYPIEELPYWRLPMRRRHEEGRWANLAREHPELIDQVRSELKERGPLGNRDLTGNRRVNNNYRGRKDTSLALYCLWITGETLIQDRQGFQRLYDFYDGSIPPELRDPAPDEEAEDFFARKLLSFYGLAGTRRWKDSLAGHLQQNITIAEGETRMKALVQQGAAVPVQVEGSRGVKYALREDLPLLEMLEAGEVPQAWQPLDTTTLEETVFLAPLDIVSARGRAAGLFDFDYVWEVYKPADQRRWGYYTLPILYGDRLAARMDPRLDNDTGTLQVNGFWVEETTSLDDPAFTRALANGLVRLTGFAGAERINLTHFPIGLRAGLQKELSGRLETRIDF